MELYLFIWAYPEGNMNLSAFTPVQRKMYHVLSDGEPHLLKDLFACLTDELTEPNTVHVHLTGMRKYLRTVGRDISMTQTNGSRFYTLTRLVAHSSRE